MNKIEKEIEEIIEGLSEKPVSHHLFRDACEYFYRQGYGEAANDTHDIISSMIDIVIDELRKRTNLTWDQSVKADEEITKRILESYGKGRLRKKMIQVANRTVDYKGENRFLRLAKGIDGVTAGEKGRRIGDDS